MIFVTVIPVKAFDNGYSRLAASIAPADRASLARGIAGRVAAVAADAGTIPLIVTADPGVAEWAAHLGFATIPDPDNGLDAAVEEGVAWAARANSRWLALHADLPLLTTDDIHALTSVDGDIIAPSADGGTSAVSSTGPVRFQYGAGSFHTHLSQMTEPAVVARTGLLHDIDTPRDLEAALNHPSGQWLRQLLR